MKTRLPLLLRAGLIAAALLPTLLAAPAALVAHWKLDEGASDPLSTTANSTVGGWTGNLNGSPAWITTGLAPRLVAQSATVAALTNTALNGYLATDYPGIPGTNARTVAAWVRTPANPVSTAAGYIVTWGSVASSVGGRFSMRLDTTAGNTLGKLRLEISSGFITGTNTVIADDLWHHVAVVCPQGARISNVVLYVDGNLQQTTTTTPSVLLNMVNLNPVHIGGYPPLNANTTFLGAIDDVRIYDEALTAAQIAELVYGPGNPPGITQQPGPQTALLGVTNASVTFNAGVSGSPTLRFQWKKNGVNLPGATGQTHTISPVTAADLGSYSVSVSNNYGGVLSAGAPLTWSTPLIDPVQQTVLVGGTAAFQITMSSQSAGYTYQWQRDGAPLGGETAATLTRAGASLADTANYAVAVALGTQSATSAPAALRVLAAPASVYATMVLEDGASGYWRLGEASGATVATDLTGFNPGAYSNYFGAELQQPGALTGDANTASQFLSANWVEVPYSPALQHHTRFSLEVWAKADATGGRQSLICARNQFFSSGYELAVNGTTYQFRTGQSTSPASESWNDLNAGAVTPGVWQHVVATYDGTIKRLYVDGVEVGTQTIGVLPTPVPLRLGAGLTYNPVPGNFFSGTLDEAAVYWKTLTADQVSDHYFSGTVGAGVAPSINAQPQDQRVLLGATNGAATFSVTATGSPRLRYQWFKGLAPLAGQTTRTLTLSPVAAADLGTYSVTVSNSVAGLASSSATLSYGTAPIAPAALALLAGGSGSFSVTMPAGQTYTYQWKHAGTNLPGQTGATLNLSPVTVADGGAYTVVVTLGTDSAESDPATLTVIPAPTQTYAQTITADAPVAWWRMGDAPGSFLIAEEGGLYAGNPGSDVTLGIEGAPLGDANTAARFTGYNLFGRAGLSKVDVFHDPAINPSVFSVECWALVRGGAGTYRSPVTSRNVGGTGVRGFLFYAGTDNRWQFWLGASNAFSVVVGPAVVENEWAHLVGTYDGATARFYVNGALVATGNAAYLPNDFQPLRIGAGATETANGDFYFPGSVDEVAVYDRALSVSAIQAHYAAAFPANAAPRFTLQPLPRGALTGSATALAAKVHSGPPVAYQWQRSGTNLPAETAATLSLTPAQPADSGTYRLVATHDSSSATSSNATLTVQNGEAVSVSFRGFENVRTIAANGGVAGMVSAGNWNEVGYNVASGSATGLRNHLGQTNGMSVTWASPGVRRWDGPYSAPAADFALLNGTLQADAVSNVVVTLSGIPAEYQAAGYDLHIYLGAPYAAIGAVYPWDTFGAVNVGGSSRYFHAQDLAFWDGRYVTATTTDPNNPTPPDANHAVFTGLNGASATIQLAVHPLNVGPAMLSGIQLVAHVAPATPVPLAIQQQGGAVVLSWAGNWVLQRKAALDGNLATWQDVAGATSPYNVPLPLGAQQFYRLRQP